MPTVLNDPAAGRSDSIRFGPSAYGVERGGHNRDAENVRGGATMEFKEVVRRRRTYRHFENDGVDRAVLERIAAEAQRVPSAGFSQGQRLLVITEPEARRGIAKQLHEDELVAEGFDPYLSECAALFIPCVSEEIYHRRYREPDKLDEQGQEIRWDIPYWWVDIGCTMMLILLAAVDEGLGAGYWGVWNEDIAFLRENFGIPDELVPIGVISVGRPLPDRRSPSLKRGWIPLEEFARWEQW
jgi:nitroreductase